MMNGVASGSTRFGSLAVLSRGVATAAPPGGGLADDERRRQRVDQVRIVGRVAEWGRHGDPDDGDHKHGDRAEQELTPAERADEAVSSSLMGEGRPRTLRGALAVARHEIRSPSGTGSSAASGEAGRAPSRRRSQTP